MQARATVCKRVQHHPPPRMRQVVNHGNGTIAVQEIAKIDQNAQKSAILTNKNAPEKRRFVLFIS